MIRIVCCEEDEKLRKRKLRCLADKLYEKAMDGEGWAMCQLVDRLEGKPIQQSELTVRRISATELGDDELADIAAGSSEGADPPPVNPSQLN